ncbi:hypothetical protein P775_22150 [Puniceibacterium antarcticum]|uniref:Uncharacterized protein n=1 Tax=Puniceibacterium antarcticum TaxID=1206336 RepID=A0A2G8R8X2_9RHOB|nr:hypothetical protein P775_22150 [Puniceibacterium antarcticum]
MLSGSEVVLSNFIGSNLTAMSLFSHLRKKYTVLAVRMTLTDQKVRPDAR